MSEALVVAASAVSAAGIGRPALRSALRHTPALLLPVESLKPTHGDVVGAQVPAGMAEAELSSRRLQGKLSRSALLAAVAVRRALAEAEWSEGREEIGYFLGVGASGCSIAEIEAMLTIALKEEHLSLALMGSQALSACNPLFAFQAMHNFTLCHGAIAEELGGPNAAFYSRGAGTVGALEEAVSALEEQLCHRVLAGGADTLLHPLTWAELLTDGAAARGLIPGEGAAILALSRSSPRSLAAIEKCGAYSGPSSLAQKLERALADLGHREIDCIAIAPWGEPPRQQLRSFAAAQFPGAVILDVTAKLGECVAASPALGWVAAIDALLERGAGRALALSAGLDAELGCVLFRRGEA